MAKNKMKTYEIVEKGKAIKCLVCNMTSYNENDVREKYCGNCHQFHNILEYLQTEKMVDMKKDT